MLARTVVVLSLVVRVYDTFGVPAADLASAHAVARAILQDAGIAVAWRNCSAEPCEERVAPAEIVMRIVAAPPASEPGSLGFSYVDVEHRSGTLATVFADRVNVLEALAGGDGGHVLAGPLLGRAMAHEIGHLLLGTVHHADRGLMRGRWTTIDLRKNQPWDWTLSREEAAQIRRAIAVRQRHPEPPAAIVARK